MKKLIVLSVVFALMVGSVFAVDLSGTFFGTVDLIDGTSASGQSDIKSSGYYGRVRLDGAGDAADGVYGGYIRLDGGDLACAYAWWKPIDQFKLRIGKDGDGFWGKEGVTGWGFNQMPNDSSVAVNYGIWDGGIFQAWDASSGKNLPTNINNRSVFFGGWGADSLMLEITPADMFSINLAIPFTTPDYWFDSATHQNLEDVFKGVLAQVNVNLDVGNIAVTYNGSDGADGTIFASFNGALGDLGLDVGFAYHLNEKLIGFGAGVKYATDSFGVKFRVVAGIFDGGNTAINATVLPYFSLSDNLAAFVNAGLALTIYDAGGDPTVGWFVNPYLRVGAEWGPSFYAGVKVYSNGVKAGGSDAVVDFAIPIAIMVSF